jgi:hypothetical protein
VANTFGNITLAISAKPVRPLLSGAKSIMPGIRSIRLAITAPGHFRAKPHLALEIQRTPHHIGGSAAPEVEFS